MRLVAVGNTSENLVKYPFLETKMILKIERNELTNPCSEVHN